MQHSLLVDVRPNCFLLQKAHLCGQTVSDAFSLLSHASLKNRFHIKENASNFVHYFCKWRSKEGVGMTALLVLLFTDPVEEVTRQMTLTLPHRFLCNLASFVDEPIIILSVFLFQISLRWRLYCVYHGQPCDGLYCWFSGVDNKGFG